MKRIITIIGAVVLFSLIAGGVYYFIEELSPSGQNPPETQTTHQPCLKDNEVASYEINKRENEVSLATIFIKNKQTDEKVFSFQIELPIPDHYHPIELHRCGVYATRDFNYNFSTRKSLPGYRMELWKYNYDGNGEKLILLDEDMIGDLKGYKHYFSTDFRVDSAESYVFLVRSYLGQPDYALVVKNLKTREDVFVLTLDEILEQYPNIQPGSFGLGIFTPDNKYHWGDIYIGAYETVYYRIEMGTWKTDILSMPLDLPSGAERAWNFKGWLAYADITSFTGLEGVTEQIEEGARKEGKMKNLWIYNLLTKEKIKIASVDPGWRFNIQWLSDTELEYFIPSGEKKIYNVENR